MADTQRYWDGERWTDHIAPGLPAAYRPRAAPQNSHGGLIAAGFVAAALLPFVGFIIGIVLIAKDKPRQGVGCMILSIVAFAFWYNQFAANTATTIYYGG